MTSTASETDLGIGFAALFFLLAAGAVLLMLVTNGLSSAFGFGGAVLFGILLIVAIHVYE